MSAWVRCLLLSGIVVFAVPLSLPAAENPAPAPNSDPFYQQLRNLMLSSEAVGVSNFTLHRDVGTFLLRSGTVCFVGPVNGKVTGAAFNGEGSFVLDPGSTRNARA